MKKSVIISGILILLGLVVLFANIVIAQGAAVCVSESVPLFTSSNKIWLNEPLNSVRTTLTKSDLRIFLADGRFSGDVETGYTQTIEIGNYPQVIYARQPTSSDDPDFGLRLSVSLNNYLYKTIIGFDKAVNFLHPDSIGKEIVLFGKKYTISSNTNDQQLILSNNDENLIFRNIRSVLIEREGVNKEIEGTLVFFLDSLISNMKEFVIFVSAPDSDNDAILSRDTSTGGPFIDPVFGTFKIDFQTLHMKEYDDKNRDMIMIRNIGDYAMQMDMTDMFGNAKTIKFAISKKRCSQDPNLPCEEFINLEDLDGKKIVVMEEERVYKGEYVIVGNEDNGRLLKVLRIVNRIGIGGDRVEFTDVFSGESIDVTITSEGTGTVSIAGKVYNVRYTDDRLIEDDEYVRISYPDSNSPNTAIVYPTIQTSKGAKVTFYKPLIFNPNDWNGRGDKLQSLKIPNGNGYKEFIIGEEDVAGEIYPEARNNAWAERCFPTFFQLGVDERIWSESSDFQFLSPIVVDDRVYYIKDLLNGELRLSGTERIVSDKILDADYDKLVYSVNDDGNENIGMTFLYNRKEIIINLAGVQKAPNVHGRYITYLQDSGAGFDVHVYDLGENIEELNDDSVIPVTNDGSNHKYSNPVLDNANGRYIAWLNDGKEIYVKDLGFDKKLRTDDDKEIRKIDINSLITDRQYESIDNIVISGGKIVFDARDKRNGDKDVLLLDLTNDKIIFVADKKVSDIDEGNIDEEDPYISGSSIVYISDIIADTEFVWRSKEMFQTNILTPGNCPLGIICIEPPRMISSSNDACDALEPSLFGRYGYSGIATSAFGDNGIFQVIGNELTLELPEGNKIENPALVIIEEKDNKDKYNAVIVTLEPGDNPNDGMGVDKVIRSWNNDQVWDSIILASDSRMSKEADVYGTIARIDASNSDQRTALVSYPDEQAHALIYLIAGECNQQSRFIRGDADNDGRVTLTDSIKILKHLFQSGQAPDCMDAADSDDDGRVTLTDAIYTLKFLFQSGPAIPPPYPGEGFDPTQDSLTC